MSFDNLELRALILVVCFKNIFGQAGNLQNNTPAGVIKANF